MTAINAGRLSCFFLLFFHLTTSFYLLKKYSHCLHQNSPYSSSSLSVYFSQTNFTKSSRNEFLFSVFTLLGIYSPSDTLSIAPYYSSHPFFPPSYKTIDIFPPSYLKKKVFFKWAISDGSKHYLSKRSFEGMSEKKTHLQIKSQKVV
jgi:hypothetical protein